MSRMLISETCEFILKYWKENPERFPFKNRKLEDMKAEDIFNYSPSGDLSMIWEWYYEANLHHMNSIDPNVQYTYRYEEDPIGGYCIKLVELNKDRAGS